MRIVASLLLLIGLQAGHTSPIEFENTGDSDGTRVILGPIAAKQFRDIAKGPIVKVRTQTLDDAIQIGRFRVGKDEVYELRGGYLVQRRGDETKAWSGKLIDEWTKSITNEDGKWATLLAN